MTAASFFLLARSVEQTERQLLEARARDTAGVIESLNAQFYSVLAEASLAARAARGNPTALRRLLAGRISPDVVSNVFLLRLTGGRPEVLYRFRESPSLILGGLTEGELGALHRSVGSLSAVPIAWRRSGPSPVGSYAADGGARNRVILVEVSTNAIVKEAFGSEKQLSGAAYLGPFETSFTLLGSTTQELPIRGRRTSRALNLGPGGSGLLVVAARHSLVGGVAYRAKWLVLGFGAPLSLLLGLIMEALRRRRDHALRLVGDLQVSNADLDRLGVQLTRQAFTDSLTGLANRALLIEELEDALAQSSDDQRPALLIVDLDDFKTVNDLMGHDAGDALLKEVSHRLAQCAGVGGVCARLGGDEFAILIPRTTDADEADDVAKRVVALLEVPVVLPAREVSASVSIGVCRAEGDEDADELLRNADIAMYRAKARDGAPRWERFSAEMLREFRDRLNLIAQLREGVVRGEFELDYQPILDLADGRVVSVEALVRWQHPVRGRVAPSGFIALAEETGAIVPLGRWVVNEACRQCARWRALGAQVRVSVNVSGRQLQEPDIVDVMREALDRSGLPAEALIVEITESVLIAEEEVTPKLQAIRALGVRLAVDDFGSGYSSIGYLQRFPVDILKIDRAFEATSGESDEVGLLEAIVQLGRSLGLEAVAEGIETERQEADVRGVMCDYGQGYYFSRPVSADAIEALLVGVSSEALLQIAATRADDVSV